MQTKLKAPQGWSKFLPVPALQILVTFSVGLYTQLDIVYICLKELLRVRPHVNKHPVTEIRIEYKKTKRKVLGMLVCALIAAWINAYSMMQFVLLHRCSVSLWNLPTPDNPGGCIEGDSSEHVMNRVKEELR